MRHHEERLRVIYGKGADLRESKANAQHIDMTGHLNFSSVCFIHLFPSKVSIAVHLKCEIYYTPDLRSR